MHLQGPPPSHVAPGLIEAFGASLENMRKVWRAGQDSFPFIVSGSGTMAMEMAVTNLLQPGEKALVINTGYFSDRMARMLLARGVEVEHIRAAPGDVPPVEALEKSLSTEDFRAVFITHVDTSTGVRVDPEPICELANRHGVLTVFDGVCATVGERFEMASWGADVYLTSSQKAIGLPCGLGLMVISGRALKARKALDTPPPLSLDWLEWLPIMEAYQARRPSYFSTPATNLILALDVGLKEILDQTSSGKTGMESSFHKHARVASAMRQAWKAMGLELLPVREEIAANTLSAILYPPGTGPALLGHIKINGVVVAGGLYPGRKGDYFRVGHMGYATTRDDFILRTVEAIEAALGQMGIGQKGRGVDACARALD